MLTNLHILPSDFEEEDFYRLNEVLSAQSADDRPMTGSQFMKMMGVDPETAENSI
ncbi:hypothetical protein G9401_00440 [Weissella paramesenteroides]|uniref:hypothetical protein n=1 Tax=Weissella paramesenteroides TaxID=1249 RepID=UPI0023F8F914|nr:hypothetical protein [Weissella paramesenteroides]MDF8374062.1 hypothetical protein [Weissella paramesenteroides]